MSYRRSLILIFAVLGFSLAGEALAGSRLCKNGSTVSCSLSCPFPGEDSNTCSSTTFNTSGDTETDPGATLSPCFNCGLGEYRFWFDSPDSDCGVRVVEAGETATGPATDAFPDGVPLTGYTLNLAKTSDLVSGKIPPGKCIITGFEVDSEDFQEIVGTRTIGTLEWAIGQEGPNTPITQVTSDEFAVGFYGGTHPAVNVIFRPADPSTYQPCLDHGVSEDDCGIKAALGGKKDTDLAASDGTKAGLVFTRDADGNGRQQLDLCGTSSVDLGDDVVCTIKITQVSNKPIEVNARGDVDLEAVFSWFTSGSFNYDNDTPSPNNIWPTAVAAEFAITAANNPFDDNTLTFEGFPVKRDCGAETSCVEFSDEFTDFTGDTISDWKLKFIRGDVSNILQLVGKCGDGDHDVTLGGALKGGGFVSLPGVISVIHGC